MSSLLDALKKSAQKHTPRTLRGRANLVGKLLEYGEKTIKVEVLSGPIEGQVIDIEPGKNLKVKDIEKPSKAQTSSYTPIGGILRFDGVEAQQDGTFKSSWTNAWIKTPGDDHKLLTGQLVSFHDTGRTNSDDRPFIRIRVMDAKKEAKVANLAEMRSKLAEAFASDRSAMVVDTSEGFSASFFYLPGERKDGSYVYMDPEEFAASLISDMDDETKDIFNSKLASNGLTIVPVSNIPVGAKTAEELKSAIAKAEEAGKKARIMSINPYAYEAPSIGIRLAGALARKENDKLEIPAEYADRLKEAFLASAPESAKAAFHADGWRGVSDTDLKDFFAANGVELNDVPGIAWNSASIHLQKFDGSDDFFAAKTHEANRYGSPYPALECCKELRAGFATELSDAVLAVVKTPAAEASAKDEAPAADAKDEAPAADPEAEAAAAADIDDLLNDIAGEPMA